MTSGRDEMGSQRAILDTNGKYTALKAASCLALFERAQAGEEEITTCIEELYSYDTDFDAGATVKRVQPW